MENGDGKAMIDLFDRNNIQIKDISDMKNIEDIFKKTDKIYSPIMEQRESERQQKAMYSAHQDAVRKAGQLTSDITKGIQAGEDIHKLFFKAIECISLMTGDKLFYELNTENLKNIYGMDL